MSMGTGDQVRTGSWQECVTGDRGSRARGAEIDFFRFFTAGHVVDPWGTGRVGWRGADGEALKAAGGGVLHAPVLTCFAGCCFVQLL